MNAFAEATSDGLLTAEVADRNRIPLRLIGFRIPHTDERCPRRSKGGMYCTSMRGHEGIHLAKDPYDRDGNLIGWL